MADRDDHVFLADQLLEVDLALAGHDLRPARVVVAILDNGKLFLDQRVDTALVAEDRPHLRDLRHQLGVLGADRLGLERRQRAQAQVEDRLCLLLAEREASDERCARVVGVARPADDRDDLVEVLERDQVALEDVRTPLGALEPELGPPGDDLLLVVDVVAEQRLQAEGARRAVDERDHVRAERRLQRRVLVQVVEDDLRDLAALQLDPDPHALLVGLVGDVADAVQHLVVHEIGDLADDAVVAALLAPGTAAP